MRLWRSPAGRIRPLEPRRDPRMNIQHRIWSGYIGHMWKANLFLGNAATGHVNGLREDKSATQVRFEVLGRDTINVSHFGRHPSIIGPSRPWTVLRRVRLDRRPGLGAGQVRPYRLCGSLMCINEAGRNWTILHFVGVWPCETHRQAQDQAAQNRMIERVFVRKTS